MSGIEGSRVGGLVTVDPPPYSTTQSGYYTDPAQYTTLNNGNYGQPAPNHSFRYLPWRAYSETRRASIVANGIGVHWFAPGTVPSGGSNATLAASLAGLGVKHARLEINWASVRYDETDFIAASKTIYTSVLQAMQNNGIRPLILLNTNNGQPMPALGDAGSSAFTATGTINTTSVTLAGSALTSLTTKTSIFLAETSVFTAVNTSTGACTTSKPLSATYSSTPVNILIGKYEPFYRDDQTQYTATIGGWNTYVNLAINFVAGVLGNYQFDVEVFNEFGLGGLFCDVSNYYTTSPSPALPLPNAKGPPNGTLWDLASSVISASSLSGHSTVAVYYGGCNTSFFSQSPTNMPTGTSGKSYHPYATGQINLQTQDSGDAAPRLPGEPAPPSVLVQIPEGFYCDWYQGECLISELHPNYRAQAPAGFQWIFSEHGMSDVMANKAVSILRSMALWMHKGANRVYWEKHFDASSNNVFGILNTDGSASACSTALSNFAAQFAGADPNAVVVPLQILGATIGSTPIDLYSNGVLFLSDTVVVLPFQYKTGQYLVAVYLQDPYFPTSRPLQPVQISLGGANFSKAVPLLYNPLTGAYENFTYVRGQDLVVNLQLDFNLRLLSIQT